MSVRPRSMRAAPCATLARMLRWERTTPFGVPSDPEVKRMTAGSSAWRSDSGRAPIPQCLQAIRRSNRWTNVLQIDEGHLLRDRFDLPVELCLVDEGARRHDRLDLGCGAGCEDAGGAAAEVDHRRNAARRDEAEDGDRRRVGVGKHHANGAAGSGKRHQFPADRARAGQEPAIGEAARDRILDGDPARTLPVRPPRPAPPVSSARSALPER